jgi:Protein phosphatase 2C
MGMFDRAREDESGVVQDGVGELAAEQVDDCGPDRWVGEVVLAGCVTSSPAQDVTFPRSVPGGFVGGANLLGTRGTTPADSWCAGTSPGPDMESRPSMWVTVADGIGDRRGSAGAAAAAVEAVNRFLAATSVTVDSLFAAFHTASVAVDAYVAGLIDAGMDSRDVGGTTLTLAALTGTQVVCLWAGDSPAWVIKADGVHRLTPPQRPGPLRDWLGAGDVLPTLRTVDRSELGGILVGSDGLELAMDDPAWVASLFVRAPHTLATHLVSRSRHHGASDDITAAVAVDVASPLQDKDSEDADTRPIPVIDPVAPAGGSSVSGDRAGSHGDASSTAGDWR